MRIVLPRLYVGWLDDRRGLVIIVAMAVMMAVRSAVGPTMSVVPESTMACGSAAARPKRSSSDCLRLINLCAAHHTGIHQRQGKLSFN